MNLSTPYNHAGGLLSPDAHMLEPDSSVQMILVHILLPCVCI